MNVLSLFDGISCARVALDKAQIKVNKYYASEIEANAIKVSSNNYSDIISLGDVTRIDFNAFQDINLVIGGPPCQDCSIANLKRKGVEGERSSLFWYFAHAIKICRPKYFIMENVASMSEYDEYTISDALGVLPIEINASLVSAQYRRRLFWTNIPNLELPIDKKIYLSNILGNKIDENIKEYEIDSTFVSVKKISQNQEKPIRLGYFRSDSQGQRVYSIDGKSITISANTGGIGGKTGLYLINNKARQLTCNECEILQGLPINYTHGVGYNTRKKLIGNAFNVDIISHILSYI